jgi:hypothetical protein
MKGYIVDCKTGKTEFKEDNLPLPVSDVSINEELERKKQLRQSAINKLINLGLTKDEAEAL